MNTCFATIIGRLAVVLTLSLALFACGGGGGFISETSDDSAADGQDGTDSSWSLSLALLTADGGNTITSSSPATLEVRVNGAQADGAPIANEVITATTTLGTLSPEAGTALTNNEGVATLQLSSDGTLGAGTITVTADAPNGAVTQTINFQVVAAALRLGYFNDGVFLEGEIGIEPSSALIAGGSAELLVAIVDEDGQRINNEQIVLISSECIVNGKATLEPGNPISTTTGQINVTYSAASCNGEDSLTATLEDDRAAARGVVTIADPAARSLGFVSATPTTIVLKGTGGGAGRQESSTVVFRVLGNNNNPLGGVPVSFSLTTEVGGIELAPASAETNADGEASVTVFAGNIPTPVRVAASIIVDNQTLSTVSDILAISTGLPTQNSISLSVGDGFVVEEGFSKDGIQKVLTVRMGDKFNNPVPDGTAANFTTEYGTIDPSCTTGTSQGERLALSSQPPLPGECAVLWTSGEPRTPALGGGVIVRVDRSTGYSCSRHNGVPNGTNGGFPCPDDLGSVRGGRSTVLVYAVGEEDFIDRNGNGIMDEEEKDAFIDLSEAFIDHNEDGRFNPVADCPASPDGLACKSGFEETFIDFNNDGSFNSANAGDSLYNGLLCPREGDNIWCSRTLVNVRASLPLILSNDPNWFMILVDDDNKNVVSTSTANGDFTVYLSDTFNNPPSAGSTISVSPGATGDCEISSATSIDVPAIAAPGAFSFPLETSGTGTVDITLNPAGGAAPFPKTFDCSP